MTVWGYVRTSTDKQNLGLNAQVRSLMDVGVDFEHIIKDQYTGKTKDRPGYKELMQRVKCGDKIIFTKLDRMGRSVVMVLSEIDRLAKEGVDIKFLDVDLDTATPMGKVMVTIISAFAEFERNMISQRVIESLEEIKTTGYGKRGQRVERLGRPNVVDLEEVARRHADGQTPRTIATELGCTRQTVYNILKAKERTDG